MLTRSWIQLQPHEKQKRLWETKKRFVNVAAGRGSGKTELARRRVIRMLAVQKEWPDPIYFYALPTYDQARRVAWGNLKSLVPRKWLASEPNESRMTIRTIFGSELYVVGLDKPQRVEGVQWDGGVIDESCDQKPGVFEKSLLPAFSHRNAWCWRIGVPKRAGIGAVEFRKYWDLGMSGEDPEVESYTWTSAEILGLLGREAEIDTARRTLDTKDFNEQYNANWEDAGGGVFYAFSDIHNVSDNVCYDPNRPIVVGSDFNVDPMAWVVGHRIGRDLHIFDELFIRNINTRRSLDVLAKRYNNHTAGWEFFGDATGRSRKTSASQSDYIIIRADNRFEPKRVYYPKSNPPVADRFAATNAVLCNAAGERRCLIHPRCKHLIEDFQARSYKEGTTDVDDYGDIGHITDAIGYLIHRAFPLRAAYKTAPTVITSTAA